MRFAMTARTLARQRDLAGKGKAEVNEITQKNIDKVTRYREDGEEALEDMVKRIRGLEIQHRGEGSEKEKRWGGKV
jgi:large subunit ribosomal protein L17